MSEQGNNCQVRTENSGVLLRTAREIRLTSQQWRKLRHTVTAFDQGLEAIVAFSLTLLRVEIIF